MVGSHERGSGAPLPSNLTDEAAPRRRGGQPGNVNALKHGRRSKAAERRRKATRAALKAAMAVLLGMPGGFPPGCSRPRPRRLRADQLALLAALDPEAMLHLGRFAHPRHLPADVPAG